MDRPGELWDKLRVEIETHRLRIRAELDAHRSRKQLVDRLYLFLPSFDSGEDAVWACYRTGIPVQTIQARSVEPTSDIAMGEGINGYTLEKLVADFPYGSLWEFHDFEYEACRKDFGLERKFSGEFFYRAANNVFLGRASTPAIVGSLDGKVYKISICLLCT